MSLVMKFRHRTVGTSTYEIQTADDDNGNKDKRVCGIMQYRRIGRSDKGFTLRPPSRLGTHYSTSKR